VAAHLTSIQLFTSFANISLSLMYIQIIYADLKSVLSSGDFRLLIAFALRALRRCRSHRFSWARIDLAVGMFIRSYSARFVILYFFRWIVVGLFLLSIFRSFVVFSQFQARLQFPPTIRSFMLS
jgi:hypothetical protein